MKKKPRSAKLSVSKFEVTGKGRFPLDMLRYDSCVPDRQEDAAEIERAMDDPTAPRRVRLRHYAADPKNEPTAQRWASFGWTVDPDSLLAPGYGGSFDD